MSSGSEQHSSTTPNPATVSPLENAPKLSPSRSRTRSPRRRPLHERSNSHSNQYASPTIRIVEDVENPDPSPDVYSKTPFPSQPSQILPPRKKPGYAFEDRGRRVSDSSFVAHAVAKLEAQNQSLVPKPLQPKKAVRHSTSTSNSDADTVVAASFSPSSSRFSTGSTAPSSINQEEGGLEILQEETSPPRQSTIRAVSPSNASSEGPLDDHALTPKASAASFASTDSLDSFAYRPSGDEPGSSENVEVINRSLTHTPSSGSDKTKQASSEGSQGTTIRRPAIKISSESIEYTESSYSSDRPRSASSPSPILHDAHHVAYSSGVRVSYPIVRAPSASSLWAESQRLPNISSRMNPPASRVHQWSSQLSTIASESDRASRSIDRQSQSIDRRSQSTDDYPGNGRSNIPRRRKTISSISSSDGHASSGNDSAGQSSAQNTESSVPVPLPLFSPITRPSNERTSDELHDTVSPLQSPPLHTKRSWLKRRDSDSRSTSSRPGSANSNLSTFIANTIPAWARVYYSHGENTYLGAPESSTEASESRVPTATSGRSRTPSESHFPLSIYRPRNRPHQRTSNRDSMSISEAPVDQQPYVVGPPRRPISEVYTPRLRPDRRSQARLSAWKAPSFDDSLGSLFFSRQNRQILLFCLGFLFPFAWMIASFLPLPANPELAADATPSQVDLENQFAKELGPVDDRSYHKAMWWRNLNRIMAAVGTLLVGVIIALAILASRMS